MTEAQERGEVITFYSYKGGTGRSMALANIACLLATEQAAKGGKPVLAIDWDLEAPGLHRYFEPFLRGRGEEDGLIELVEDLRSRVRTGCAPDEEEEMSEEVVAALDVKRFALPTSYPKLSFIRAGRFDDTYSTRTNTFKWPELFAAAPSLFRLLADRLAEEFSYVLIDSRTGITDTSGICTTLMPEKLVLVFTPNRQSLTGITDLVKRAYAYRRGSDDVRPLVAYPLPSRIETSLPQEMKRWRLGDEDEGIVGWEPQFTELLRGVYELPESFSLERYFDAVQAQHVPPYAYGEPIAVLRERNSDRLTLTKSYDTFRAYLVRNAPWDEVVSPVQEVARQATLEQLNRLNEEFRVATEAVRPSATALPQPTAAPPARSGWPVALAIATALAIVAAFLLFRRNDERVVDPHPVSANTSAFAQIIAAADDNAPSTTALLLASVLDDLEPKEQALAEEQLLSRLAYMPAPLFRVPTGKAASLSLTGDRLLVLNGEGTLTRIEISTGKPLDVPAQIYVAAAERPDGTFVTVTQGGTLEVHRDGRLVAADPLEEKDGVFRFGPRGEILVHAVPRGGARVWTVAGDEPARVVKGSRRALRPLTVLRATGDWTPNGVFSGDGETVATMDGYRLAIVGTQRGIANLKADRPQLVALDRRGTAIAVVSASGTSIRDITSGKELAAIAAVPTDLAFDAAGKSLLAIIPVNTVARFDAQTGVQTGVLSYQDREVRSVDFLDDGRAITIFDDRIEVGQPLAERAVTTIEPPGRIVETAYDANVVVIANEYSVGAWRLELQRPDKGLTGAALVAEVCRRVGRDLTDQEWTTYFGSVQKEPVCQTTNQEKVTK
ncbi:MAG TPA: hypothetical protein VGD79_10535 [Thermoanaerobaculia bacterium]|jgi:cellulose biosynthesis protein BcsQ